MMHFCPDLSFSNLPWHDSFKSVWSSALPDLFSLGFQLSHLGSTRKGHFKKVSSQWPLGTLKTGIFSTIYNIWLLLFSTWSAITKKGLSRMHLIKDVTIAKSQQNGLSLHEGVSSPLSFRCSEIVHFVKGSVIWRNPEMTYRPLVQCQEYVLFFFKYWQIIEFWHCIIHKKYQSAFHMFAIHRQLKWLWVGKVIPFVRSVYCRFWTI